MREQDPQLFWWMGNQICHQEQLAKRRHETLTHASAIRGGSKNNPGPAFDGMFDTLAKRCKVDKMKDYVLGQKTLKEKVASATFKKNVKAFESSAENAKRSIAVFYSSGVMGKRKYKSVRISLSMKTNETTKGRSAISVMPKCPIPKLLPYDRLVKEINQIDIMEMCTGSMKSFQGQSEMNLLKVVFES